jgi:1-acyl-sn-glycerol-3-phosphate acyltransferase
VRGSLLSDLETLRRGWRWGGIRPAGWPERAAVIPERESDLTWARTDPVRMLRWLIQRGVSLPFTRAMSNPRVEGREWLNELDRPGILVSNHVSHADTQLLLYALSDRVREKTVVAAAADYWYQHRLLGQVVGLWLNTFPFARTGSPQAVLSSAREVLKSGWHLLIYPEGTRSPDGKMQEFKPGPAYLAVENRTPVVPMHVRGSQRIMPRGRPIPLPAPAEIRIGRPLWPGQGEGSRAFTRRIEGAVRELASARPDNPARGGWIDRWHASGRRSQ